jgi:hypothetical protein
MQLFMIGNFRCVIFIYVHPCTVCLVRAERGAILLMHLAEHPCAEGMQPARPPPHACAAAEAAAEAQDWWSRSVTRIKLVSRGRRVSVALSVACVQTYASRSKFAVAAAAASSVFAEDSRSRHGELSHACSIGLRYFLSFCVSAFYLCVRRFRFATIFFSSARFTICA